MSSSSYDGKSNESYRSNFNVNINLVKKFLLSSALAGGVLYFGKVDPKQIAAPVAFSMACGLSQKILDRKAKESPNSWYGTACNAMSWMIYGVWAGVYLKTDIGLNFAKSYTGALNQMTANIVGDGAKSAAPTFGLVSGDLNTNFAAASLLSSFFVSNLRAAQHSFNSLLMCEKLDSFSVVGHFKSCVFYTALGGCISGLLTKTGQYAKVGKITYLGRLITDAAAERTAETAIGY